ncbi:MAG TPA: metal-sensing transcriptional repressor [Candidatus Baltobacteraceae bacterium]|nr:metal-sensing transcriptional repressor [Candidatus Baltobacteraceae bacterium]
MATHRKTTAAQPRRGRQELQLSEDVVDQIQGRLRRVEGQIAAIQRMIAERRDCHAIAQQMSAARAALDRAAVQLMAQSMAQCLRPNGVVDEHELTNLTETFIKLLA